MLRYPILGTALIVLAACSPAQPIPAALPMTPLPAATWTATAAPAATNTPPRPTDLPSPTATASPAPLEPTATATAPPAPAGNLDDWRLPLVAAGLTQMSIVDLERLAVEQPADAVAQAIGLGIALGAVDDALEAWQPGREQAGYVEPLRANLASVGGIVGQWYDGEMSASDVVAALTPVRASSEQVLDNLAAEMLRLGVSQRDIDALMAEIAAGP